MSAIILAKKMAAWIVRHRFCSEARVGRIGDDYLVEFVSRTTKTRASSMVTRIGLIAAEVAAGAPIFVGKKLLSGPPRDRDDVVGWIVYVRVPIRKRSGQKVSFLNGVVPYPDYMEAIRLHPLFPLLKKVMGHEGDIPA